MSVRSPTLDEPTAGDAAGGTAMSPLLVIASAAMGAQQTLAQQYPDRIKLDTEIVLALLMVAAMLMVDADVPREEIEGMFDECVRDFQEAKAAGHRRPKFAYQS